MAGATSYTLPAANITATGTGTIHAWIDFDRDGNFALSEYQSVAVTAGVLAGSLSWSGITVGAAGTSYARIRFTSTTLTDTAGTAVDERAIMAAADGEVEDYQIAVINNTPPNVTQTCAIRDGKNYTSGNPTLWWDVNSFAYPGGMEENNVPALVASASTVSFGAGLSATKVSSYWGISNINATTAAQARSNNEYLQVSFTTQSSITSYLERWGTYTAINMFPGVAVDIATQPDFSDAVKFYEGNNAGSNFHYFTGTGDQLLEAGKTYYVRIYFYGAVSGSLDSFDLQIGSCSDFGDVAPNSTAFHAQSAPQALYLGATKPDTEVSSQDAAHGGSNGSGDGADEDGVASFPSLYTTSNSYTLNATVTNTSGSAATLYGWIDTDGSGTFDSDEYASVPVPNGTNSGTVTLNWTNLSGLVAGTTYARLRLTTTALTSAGAGVAASNGEVEDYAITITSVGTVNPVPPTSCGNLLSAEYDGTFGTLASGTRNLQTLPGGSYSYTGDLMAAGRYTVVSKVGSPSIHGVHWRNILGVTTGTADDAYLAVNGSTAVGVFYKQTIPLQGGRSYRISVFAINAVSGENAGGDPELGIRLIRESNGAVVGTTSTGVIQEKYPATYGGFQGPQDWTQGTLDLTTPATDNYRLEVFNISTDASGNDFAIDGISIAPLTEAGCPKDYSDAPIATLGGAVHALVPNFSLGASVTTDSADYNSANADGDVDNGVTFPPLIRGGNVTIPASVIQPSASNGYLQGWIDWNGDGDFADAGEQIATNLQYSAGTTGTINIPVTVPANATTSQTYARFRWSSTSGLSSTAAASDGEVEDYALMITSSLTYPAAASEAECPVAAGASFTPNYQVGWNHGGANPYAPTLQGADIASAQNLTAGSGISYLIDASSGRILNADQAGRVNAYQLGDYAQYTFTTSATVSAGRFWKGLRYGMMPSASIHTPYKISVLVSTDPSFTTATLLLDGHTVTAPPTVYTQTVVPFTAASYLLPSTTYYVRVIFHDSSASSGELRWDDLVLGFADCRDYSDAPTTATSYGTAPHAITDGGTLRLGSNIDAEPTGLASANADGDDTNGTADEDSIASFPSLSTENQKYSLNLQVTNTSGSTARLVAWIDFNRNGVFDNNEAATTNVANGITNKMIGITWPTIPSSIQAGSSFLRLRLTTDPSIATGTASTSQATGVAIDGEVEDYVLTISNGGVSVSGTVYHDLNADGVHQTEPGIGQVTMVLYDSTNNTCRSTQTNAQGQYRFDQVAAGNYTVYEAAAEALPQPNTCPPVGADLNAYLSSTPNTQAITVSTASINGIDFGDVQKPQFTLEHSQTTLPGATVTYAHRFTALADGTVSFSLADGSDPANLNWDVVLYVDTNCNAALDGGDTELDSAFLMAAGQSLCLIAKVLAPSNVSSGASHILEITSSFTFGDGSRISTPVTQTRTDLTRASAGSPTGGSVDGAGKLKLSKAVWNVTRNIQGDVALPGETLRYLISYENIGNGALDELAVQDRVPEFTSLTGLPQCGTTPPELTLCSPTVGGLDLEWVFTGKLLPGSQGQVFYDVLVE